MAQTTRHELMAQGLSLSPAPVSHRPASLCLDIQSHTFRAANRDSCSLLAPVQTYMST